jgi:hypothetical protein
MSVYIGAIKSNYIESLRQEIVNGGNWSNENANWFTLFKPSENRYMIVINDKNYFYKNSSTAAKRLGQLLNRGY